MQLVNWLHTVFSRYAIVSSPQIEPNYLFELGPVRSQSPWLCRVKDSEGQDNSNARTGIMGFLNKACVTQVSTKHQGEMTQGCQCCTLFSVASTVRKSLKNGLFPKIQ